MPEEQKKIPLWTIFLRFLVIGATSFGGFMALVSMVQREVVERKKWLSNDILLDAVSVASFLPGPLAVNVVAFSGYRLRGMWGALLSMTAVLLPTFALIVILSRLYFSYGQMPGVSRAFDGIIPGVCAVVAAVALDMGRRQIRSWAQGLILLASFLIITFFGGFYSTLFIMIAGALIGTLFFRESQTADVRISHVSINELRAFIQTNLLFLLAFAALLFVVILLPWMIPIADGSELKLYRQLALTFSPVSLTLFGGGYVFIPMLQQLVVEQLQWLNTREFADGIALGQVTPGPIMISAAFVGYKIAGTIGAAVATVAMFLPPALLMLLVSDLLESLKGNSKVISAFRGLRPAVIGMIAAAAVSLARSAPHDLRALGIGLVVFFLIARFKISAAYLIPLSAIAGLLLFSN